MKFMIPLLILALLLSAWLLPSSTLMFAVALLLVSLGIAILAILREHSAPYRLGRITQATLFRRIALDVFGVLLAVILAGWLGGYVAGLWTRSLPNETGRLVAMVLIGLLVGLGVGLVVTRAWGRLTKIASS